MQGVSKSSFVVANCAWGPPKVSRALSRYWNSTQCFMCVTSRQLASSCKYKDHEKKSCGCRRINRKCKQEEETHRTLVAHHVVAKNRKSESLQNQPNVNKSWLDFMRLKKNIPQIRSQKYTKNCSECWFLCLLPRWVHRKYKQLKTRVSWHHQTLFGVVSRTIFFYFFFPCA